MTSGRISGLFSRSGRTQSFVGLLPSSISQTTNRDRVTKYVTVIPGWFDDFFRRFDDWGLYWAQKLYNTSRFWHYFGLFFTLATTIEIGISVPFLLYLLGNDFYASETTFLMFYVILVSQIPKRFLWRDRPYMANRASQHRPDATSSFPSRAVTCGVVYTWALLATLDDAVKFQARGWIVGGLVVLLVTFCVSLSRVMFGVHYPSDCLMAVVQGVVIVAVSMYTEEADMIGCLTCRDGTCYKTLHQITASNFFRLVPRKVLATVTLASMTLCWLLMCRPLRFWVKCHHILGMLAPCIAFELTMLCYPLNGKKAALGPPARAGSQPLSWAAGVLVSLLLAFIGVNTRPIKAPASASLADTAGDLSSALSAADGPPPVRGFMQSASINAEDGALFPPDPIAAHHPAQGGSGQRDRADAEEGDGAEGSSGGDHRVHLLRYNSGSPGLSGDMAPSPDTSTSEFAENRAKEHSPSPVSEIPGDDDILSGNPTVSVSNIRLSWYQEGRYFSLGGAWICWASFCGMFVIVYSTLLYWRIWGPYRPK